MFISYTCEQCRMCIFFIFCECMCVQLRNFIHNYLYLSSQTTGGGGQRRATLRGTREGTSPRAPPDSFAQTRQPRRDDIDPPPPPSPCRHRMRLEPAAEADKTTRNPELSAPIFDLGAQSARTCSCPSPLPLCLATMGHVTRRSQRTTWLIHLDLSPLPWSGLAPVRRV